MKLYNQDPFEHMFHVLSRVTCIFSIIGIREKLAYLVSFYSAAKEKCDEGC